MHETVKFCVSLTCNGVSVHFHCEVHMVCVGNGKPSLNVCSTDVCLCKSNHHS